MKEHGLFVTHVTSVNIKLLLRIIKSIFISYSSAFYKKYFVLIINFSHGFVLQNMSYSCLTPLSQRDNLLHSGMCLEDILSLKSKELKRLLIKLNQLEDELDQRIRDEEVSNEPICNKDYKEILNEKRLFIKRLNVAKNSEEFSGLYMKYGAFSNFFLSPHLPPPYNSTNIF